ncbi:MAG: DUF6524 family protein [Acidobacteria bacterium]|nr:DUF6524 family protein [Acidobacteriota bacterium]
MAAVSIGGFLVRFVSALVLVLATYNPEGLSYYHWVREKGDGPLALKAFVGVLLLIAWVFMLRSARRSLGTVGIILSIALFGTFLWLVLSVADVSPQGSRAFTYLGEIVLAGVLSMGLVWSRLRRRVTGQVDVKDVSD